MSNTAIVQSVTNVARAEQPLPEASPQKAIEALLHSKVEACSEYHGNVVVSPYHPFVASVHAAFNDHRPLVLSPDMLWLLTAQGLARHVNANSEELRDRFVQHDGKEKIIVRRDDFIKGSAENPWGEVLGEFSAQIKKHIGEENHSNIVASFSTTGAIEKAANEIVLMDSLKNYFNYEASTMCGIPEVRLEGTADDWKKLHDQAELLGSTYDLTWWTNRIIPTLKQIASNAAGADDPELWKNIYKIDDNSGGPYINGWLVDFFPYLQTSQFFRKANDEPVVEMDEWKEMYDNPDDFYEKTVNQRNWLFSDEDNLGITVQSLPGSLCKTPFIWKYFTRQHEMEFVAGFIGFSQSADDLAVRPKIGWAVRET